MTLIEAINKIDELKPNGYPQAEKIEWLSNIDGIIKRTIIDTHEDGEDIEFNGYNENTPLDTKLIVDAPHEEIYILWLETKIDYANAEYVKYNNSITRFNDIYQTFTSDYNRHHMPIGSAIKYF